MEQLQKLVDGDKKALADPNGAGMEIDHRDGSGVYFPSPQLEIIKKRLASEERDLAKAKEALTDLEREAARKAVPLEWRR